jgi:hypothetical protein
MKEKEFEKRKSPQRFGGKYWASWTKFGILELPLL